MSTKTIEYVLKPNTILKNGLYVVRRILGAGGFGVTYLGVKKSVTAFEQDKKVVIKELFLAPSIDNYNCIRDTNNGRSVYPSQGLRNDYEGFKERFKKEAETLYRFRDLDGMVRVLDYFEENNTYYFTMDYIESQDLLEYVTKGGAISLEGSLKLINRIGGLLHQIHQHKVLHRDVKPQNILIDNNGNAYLIDFGIAKSYDNMDYVSKITGFHSKRYSPPEQFANKMNLISEAMDVHALAATFYFCLTGHQPPTLEDRILNEKISVTEINPKLPSQLDVIINKAMAIKPQERTPTIQLFLNEINQLSKKDVGKDFYIPSTKKDDTSTQPDIKIKEPTPVPFILKPILKVLSVILLFLFFIKYFTTTNFSTSVNVSGVDNLSIDIELVPIRGGTFTMGCTAEQGSECESDEKPAHRVTLSDYYIGKYEVTQRQWKAVMGSYPTELYNTGCDDCPVEQVSWDDVQEFIKKLNQKTGKAYRLPTEAEWEYAARGGQQYKYAGSNSIDEVAWYVNSFTQSKAGSKGTTYPVGQKKANGYGLYDMSGNVHEWCSDWYGLYSSATVTNPEGPTSGSQRVSRGGNWKYHRLYCCVSNRYSSDPVIRYNDIGFRLASSVQK